MKTCTSRIHTLSCFFYRSPITFITQVSSTTNYEMHRRQIRSYLVKSMDYSVFKNLVSRRHKWPNNMCITCMKDVPRGRFMRGCNRECAEEYLRNLKQCAVFAMIRSEKDKVSAFESEKEINDAIDAQEIQVASWNIENLPPVKSDQSHLYGRPVRPYKPAATVTDV
jgi:hypothetical protein